MRRPSQSIDSLWGLRKYRIVFGRREADATASTSAIHIRSAFSERSRTANAVGGVATRGLSGRRAPAAGDNPVVLAVNKADPAPPPPPRTKWTRRVPHAVLIGHAASLSQADLLPKDAHMDRVRNWVRSTAKKLGSPRVVDVVMVRCLPARRWRCAAGRCLSGID